MALAIEQPEWISIGVNRLPRGMPARRPAPLMSESDLELLGVLALQPLRRPSSPGPGASCRRIAVLGHPRRFRATRLATSSATEDIRLRQAEFGDRGTHMCNRGRSGLFSSRFNFSIDGCAFGKKFAEFLIFGHGYFAKDGRRNFIAVSYSIHDFPIFELNPIVCTRIVNRSIRLRFRLHKSSTVCAACHDGRMSLADRLTH